MNVKHEVWGEMSAMGFNTPTAFSCSLTTSGVIRVNPRRVSTSENSRDGVVVNTRRSQRRRKTSTLASATPTTSVAVLGKEDISRIRFGGAPLLPSGRVDDI